MEIKDGTVESRVANGVGYIDFSHPKANSLPSSLLIRLTETIQELDSKDEVRVLCLRSEGDKAFCAGASFEEFQSIDSEEQAIEFFMGFANCLIAMRSASKFIVVRVQGKMVGGGVGLASAADYAFAHESASMRLSEFDLGIGPFTIGPAVERKIGVPEFSAASIDTEWRDAQWSLSRGLFTKVYSEIAELDSELEAFLAKLASASGEATAEMKKMFWESAASWDELLPSRASISGRLLMASKA